MNTCGGVSQTMQARLKLAEARVREYEETIHEMGGTIAGVNAAARLLLTHGSVLGEDQARTLETMLSSELGRLDRLLSDARDGSVCVLDLDELLLPLVTVRRLLGHTVEWQASDLRAIGDTDGLSEAVNILLTNAVRHGKGAPITVAVEEVGDVITITVSDDGPGVAPEIRVDVFRRGVRSDNSDGQGLGLYLARERVTAQGGTLELADTPVGARFVVTLAAYRP